jgi:hypothetical protein
VSRREVSQRGAKEPDPWRKAPVGELQEQLLPRWFVVLGLALVPVAVGALVAALVVFGPDEVPVEARRPPPAGDLTHDVGAYEVGQSAPVAYDAACGELQGVQVAGTEADQARFRQALAALCNTALEPDVTEALRAFADAGGAVRFALFEATGVDSAVDLSSAAPQVLVNAKYTRIQPARSIAPLVGHDAVMLAGDPASAETALAARRAEAAICAATLAAEEHTRGCDDADELLALPDPLSALRAAGYR